jgi:hypothetical protein
LTTRAHVSQVRESETRGSYSRPQEGWFLHSPNQRLSRSNETSDKTWTHYDSLSQTIRLPKHIVKSIVRQAGLTNEEFFDLLNQ